MTLVTRDLAIGGVVYVRFGDIRDADSAYSRARSGQANHLAPPDFNAKQQHDGRGYAVPSDYEGQVLVTLKYTGHGQHFDEELLKESVIEAISKVGDIMAFRAVTSVDFSSTIRIEFYDIEVARDLILRQDDIKIPVSSTLAF